MSRTSVTSVEADGRTSGGREAATSSLTASTDSASDEASMLETTSVRHQTTLTGSGQRPGTDALTTDASAQPAGTTAELGDTNEGLGDTSAVLDGTTATARSAHGPESEPPTTPTSTRDTSAAAGTSSGAPARSGSGLETGSGAATTPAILLVSYTTSLFSARVTTAAIGLDGTSEALGDTSALLVSQSRISPATSPEMTGTVLLPLPLLLGSFQVEVVQGLESMGLLRVLYNNVILGVPSSTVETVYSPFESVRIVIPPGAWVSSQSRRRELRPMSITVFLLPEEVVTPGSACGPALFIGPLDQELASPILVSLPCGTNLSHADSGHTPTPFVFNSVTAEWTPDSFLEGGSRDISGSSVWARTREMGLHVALLLPKSDPISWVPTNTSTPQNSTASSIAETAPPKIVTSSLTITKHNTPAGTNSEPIVSSGMFSELVSSTSAELGDTKEYLGDTSAVLDSKTAEPLQTTGETFSALEGFTPPSFTPGPTIVVVFETTATTAPRGRITVP